MSWLEFLNTLEETLNHIEVKGKVNIDYMNGCFYAIEQMRQSLFSLAQQEKQKEEDKPPEEKLGKGGDEDGR